MNISVKTARLRFTETTAH